MNNEYMAAYMNARYWERRHAAILELGGKCTQCGNTENLEFDHIDRTTKTFDVSKLFSRGEARYRAELKLCQLLCHECHKKKSAAEQSVSHGGGKTGKRNCYCSLCAPLKREYMREFKRRSRGGSSAADAIGS